MAEANDPKSRRDPARIRLPLWALGVLGVLLLVVVVASSVWLFNTIRDLTADTADEPLEFAALDVQETIQPIESELPAIEVEGEPLPVIETDELKPWSGSERVNILFLGTDSRCDETGPNHSDTLMVATIDPRSRSAALFSLPRDLWVEIPGFGVDRINQAYYFGQIYEYPGGGPALAQETVEALLGVPIEYYLTVNFKAFEDAVDLIGGIVIEVPEAIEDPDYPDNCYGYDPFEIEAGTQRLNGVEALKYARTRATLGGDVDRAARQQAVLLAVRDQVLQLNQLPQLIPQAPLLWRTFQENVNTNMPLEDVLEMALLLQEIPRENIASTVLDYNHVFIETTPDGRQVLVPRREEIRVLRDEIFSAPPIPTPIVENLQQQMVEEGARVAVFNGTAVFGLAAETQTYLQELGVDVTEIGNADSAAYGKSQLIDYGSHPQTTQFLIQEMQIPPLNLSYEELSPDGDYDILVIIGSDWANFIAGETS